ncbi:hypothetical protein SALBM217S_06370 [Streptomyces griseoloalbus]
MLRPRSKTNTPGLGSLTPTGVSSSVTRTGASTCATTRSGTTPSASPARSHPASSNPGRAQPGVSLRASYVSPSSRSAATTGPDEADQSVSDTTRCTVPSA